MVDYARLSATATRLIQANGRSFTLVKFNEIAADANEPWNGPASGGQTTLTLYGVFVPPATIKQFGLQGLGQGTEFVDLVTYSEQVIITNPTTNDLRQYSEVIDDSVRWGIIGTQVLKPASTTILGFIGVRR